MKKFRKIFAIILALIMSVGIFLFARIRNAIKITNLVAFFETVSEEHLLMDIDFQETIVDEYQTFGMNPLFPSKNVDDYVNCCILISVKNTSVLETQITGVKLKPKKNLIDVCYAMNIFDEINIKRLDTRKNVLLYSLYIYRNGKTNEEIIDYISENFSLDIYTSNKLSKRKVTINNPKITILGKNPLKE